MIPARAVPVYTSRMTKTLRPPAGSADDSPMTPGRNVRRDHNGSWVWLAGVFVLVVGCGGGGGEGPKGPNGGAGGGSAAKPSAAGDVMFEVPSIEIKGIQFEPEALGRPGMPLVEAKKKITVEKQRAVLASTKDPLLKEAQAAILATLLYQKSKDAKGDEQTALIKEARQVLRDAAQVSGDKVDDVTLRLLGSYELM